MIAAMMETSPYLTAFPFALLLAAIVSCVVVFFIVRSYSMKHKPVDYPLDQYTKLNLHEKEDIFTGSHVTRRTIDRDRKR